MIAGADYPSVLLVFTAVMETLSQYINQINNALIIAIMLGVIKLVIQAPDLQQI
jgi:hypothetical protein